MFSALSRSLNSCVLARLHGVAPCMNQLLRSLADVAAKDDSVVGVPIVGAVPEHIVSSNKPFWMNIDMNAVAERFRTSAVPEVEDLPRIFASFRSETNLPLGTRQSRKLRKAGLTPAILDSLPLLQAPVHLVLSDNQLHIHIRAEGENFKNRLYLVHIIPMDELQLFNRSEQDVRDLLEKGWHPTITHTFQVLPRRVSHHPYEEYVYGVTFMNCPSHRIVNIDVPVIAQNDEESPCGKRGGFALITRKYVKVRSLAGNILDAIRIDCQDFHVGHKVYLKDVDLGEGRHAVGVRDEECLILMEA